MIQNISAPKLAALHHVPALLRRSKLRAAQAFPPMRHMYPLDAAGEYRETGDGDNGDAPKCGLRPGARSRGALVGVTDLSAGEARTIPGEWQIHER